MYINCRCICIIFQHYSDFLRHENMLNSRNHKLAKENGGEFVFGLDR